MSILTELLKLKHLLNLKASGFCYTEPLPSFAETEATSSELPSTLDELRSFTFACHLCELAKTRKSVVFGEGNPNAKVMFIGEGPGANEDDTGRPFVGMAGQLLTDMIQKAIGISRQDAYIANIVKCRPPGNRVPTSHEVACCMPYLLKQIELIRPKLLVLLGATALNSLFGQELSITKERRKVLNFNGTPLIPTYHPSYLLRNPSAKKEAYHDMLLIKSMLEK